MTGLPRGAAQHAKYGLMDSDTDLFILMHVWFGFGSFRSGEWDFVSSIHLGRVAMSPVELENLLRRLAHLGAPKEPLFVNKCANIA